MTYTMIVEQTSAYPNRLQYDPATGAFTETARESLFHARGFRQPYGWIRESGTPPAPHWDVLLMTDTAKRYAPGDEVPIRVVGVFLRNDGDHKYIAVEVTRDVDDLAALTVGELADLRRLFPRVDVGEGWFGKAAAERAMRECEKAL